MAKKKAKAKKGPRQKALPGMENRAIKALDNAALTYAEARDARVAAMNPEREAKDVLLGLMHAHKRKVYQTANISISIVPEGEKLRVKIKKADDLTEEELQDGQDVEPDEEEEEPADEPEEDFEG